MDYQKTVSCPGRRPLAATFLALAVAASGCIVDGGRHGSRDELLGEQTGFQVGDGFIIVRLDETLTSAAAELVRTRLLLTTFETDGDGVAEIEMEVGAAQVLADGRLRLELSDALLPAHTYHLISEAAATCEDCVPERRILQSFGSYVEAGATADNAITFGTLVIAPLKVYVPPPPPPDPGALELAFSQPAHFEDGVARDTDVIRLKFTDAERIDCAATGNGPQAGQLISEIPGVTNHSFFHGAEQIQTSLWYRGRIECDAGNNELRLWLPQSGDLYGDGWYRFRATVRSTVGSQRTFSIQFHTRNPGLLVRVNQVMSHDGHCDNIWNPYNQAAGRCDVYVAASVSVDEDTVSTVKLPDPSGNRTFSNAYRDYPLTVDVPTVYAHANPVERAVRLNLVAMDSDDDDARDVVAGIGALLTAAAPFNPYVGAAGGVVTVGAGLIPDNDDDLMGLFELHFTDNYYRWNTSIPIAASQPYRHMGKQYTFPNGQVSVWIRTEEYPRSWQEPPVID